MTGAILSLTTYPVQLPRHGGQRRVSAFAAFYNTVGLRLENACVYETPPYGAGDVGPYDRQLNYEDGRFRDIPFVTDLLSGLYAAEDDVAFRHFASVIEQVRPVALQLEQPFMWPLVERARAELPAARVPLVYSSQNWEAPLKTKILEDVGVPRTVRDRVGAWIERLERRCVAAASLIVTVSEADARIYRGMAKVSQPIILVPNGVNRPFQPKPQAAARVRHKFGDRPLFFFAGSAYPPNVQGFSELVSRGGFYFLPPEMHFAVCGGASHGIFASLHYHRLLNGNSARVQFYDNIDEDDLEALKHAAHAFLLPMLYGGGSNLKTAEALVSGRHVVATATALRGFEAYQASPGVRVANDRDAFRKAIIDIYHSPPNAIGPYETEKRENLFWDRAFVNSGLEASLRTQGILS